MNRQYFDKEQIKSGEFQKLLDYLMLEAYGKGDHYNDIHIKPEDLGAFIIEWEQVPWDHSFGGSFEYVDEEHVVMLERQLPDGTFSQFYSEQDYNDFLTDWLVDNPGWEKNEYGHWYNKIENDRLASDFKSMTDGDE